MKPANADCKDCRFVDTVDHPQLGTVSVCRWGPPQMTQHPGQPMQDPHTRRMVPGNVQILGGFPITGPGNWCHRFESDLTRSAIELQ